jgi:hypothetical protein
LTPRRRRVAAVAGVALVTAPWLTTGLSRIGEASVPQNQLVVERLPHLTPLPPIAPRSQDECDALEAAWQQIREGVAAQHAACLDATKDQRCAADGVTGCTCQSCAPYHNSSSLGRADVDACRTAVREYERARAIAERLAREREEEARRAAEAERQRAAIAASRREDELRRWQLDEDRRRDDARRREERERRALQELAKASAAHQQAYDALRQMREREREQLLAAGAQAASRFDQMLADARDAARRWQDRFQAALKGASPAARPQSNIDDFAFGDASDEAGSRAVDGLTGIAKSVVPFASIPITMLANSYHAAIAAINELGSALEHFDDADAAFVDGIADRFRERVFGPRAMMTVVVDEIARPIAAHAAGTDEFVAFLREGMSTRARRAWETGDIRELVRDGTPPPPSRLPIVRYWWTQNTPREPTWHTDSRGVVLLADGDGRVYGMNGTTGAVSYAADDVERLVAERGLHLVRRGPDPPWVDRVAVVVAPTSDLADAKLWDFTPWEIAAQSIGVALEAGSERVRRWFDLYRGIAK